MSIPVKNRTLVPFRSLRTDLDSVLGDLFRTYNEENGDFMSTVWQPSTDISETTKEFIVRADLPGVNKEDIELSVVDGQLNIRGKRHENKREEKEDVIRVERFSGMFFRRIPLSKIVDAEKIAAEYRDGELIVHIPKSNKSVPKKIKID